MKEAQSLEELRKELTLTPEQVARVRVIKSPFAVRASEAIVARIRSGELKRPEF